MFERLDSRSDVLTQVLNAVHLGSALSARIEVRAPWALHYGEEGKRRAGFHVVAQGSCWLLLENGSAPIKLEEGDVVVIPRGIAHTLADDPDTTAIELSDHVSHLTPGAKITLPMGTDGPAAILLCGSYFFGPHGSNPLLRGLPAILHIAANPDHRELESCVRLLAAESGAPGSGTATVVARLVDLLFVYALRAWLTSQARGAPASWFGALDDAVVGPAIRAIHEGPEYPWSVAELAKRCGVSRAGLSRRFSLVLGEPPLTYATRWRMTVAAQLLEQGERIARVASAVGYENEFAFAKAFKRVRGCAPGEYRRSASANPIAI